MYKLPRDPWAELRKEASISTITSIDVGIVTFTAATIRVSDSHMIDIRQFNLAKLFGLKNGLAPGSQMQWIEGLISLFENEASGFSGDLIVVEKQLKTSAMGRRMSTLADITLTYWKTKGRFVALGCSRGTHMYMEDQDNAIVTPSSPAILRSKGYDGNKARALHWLQHHVREPHLSKITKIATKKNKLDDIADAIRQGLWAIYKLSGKKKAASKRKKKMTVPKKRTLKKKRTTSGKKKTTANKIKKRQRLSKKPASGRFKQRSFGPPTRKIPRKPTTKKPAVQAILSLVSSDED